MKLAFDEKTATKTRRGKAFAISVSNLSPTRVEEEVNQLNQPSVSALEQASNEEEKVEVKEEISPKARSAGGVWLHASDFPNSFTNVIVYHNMGKYQHRFWHSDVWSDVTMPFTANEKEVYLRLDLDEEAFARYKEERGLDPEMTMAEMHKVNSEDKDIE